MIATVQCSAKEGHIKGNFYESIGDDFTTYRRDSSGTGEGCWVEFDYENKLKDDTPEYLLDFIAELSRHGRRFWFDFW